MHREERLAIAAVPALALSGITPPAHCAPETLEAEPISADYGFIGRAAVTDPKGPGWTT
jgi:hypothetical protein